MLIVGEAVHVGGDTWENYILLDITVNIKLL